MMLNERNYRLNLTFIAEWYKQFAAVTRSQSFQEQAVTLKCRSL